jgi:sugar phosphate isomerase/epimerase
MAIRTVVTMGFGNGTFNGTIADVARLGYTSAEVSGGTLKYQANLNQRVQVCSEHGQRVGIKPDLEQRVQVKFDVENC